MAARVSCATPVAGPIGGLLGVGLASAMAGQASIKCRQFMREGRSVALCVSCGSCLCSESLPHPIGCAGACGCWHGDGCQGSCWPRP